MSQTTHEQRAHKKRAPRGARTREKFAAIADAIAPGAMITDVAPQAGAPGRIIIRVGRRVIATLSQSLALAAHVAAGDQWSQEIRDTLAIAVETDAATRNAVSRLSRRPMTTSRLRMALRRAGFTERAVDAALSKCAQIGLLDDAAFAHALADDIVRRQPIGKRFIEAKLRSRGVSSDIAHEAAENIMRGRDAGADALALATHRARSMDASVGPNKMRQRLLAYLARRGFDAQACNNAASLALAQVASDGP